MDFVDLALGVALEPLMLNATMAIQGTTVVCVSLDLLM
jgi:hypothetical protein